MENKRGTVKRSTLQNVPDLEAEVKECVTEHRNNEFSVSSKMIIFAAR
jgi:hypothetical protein